MVYNETASPEIMDELSLLKLIERVAVKPENMWIMRETLHSMKQDVGEPITSFAARLKGQARLCGFTKEVGCSKDNCDGKHKLDFTGSKSECPNCGGEHVKGKTWKEHCPATKKKCNNCPARLDT